MYIYDALFSLTTEGNVVRPIYEWNGQTKNRIGSRRPSEFGPALVLFGQVPDKFTAAAATPCDAIGVSLWRCRCTAPQVVIHTKYRHLEVTTY